MKYLLFILIILGISCSNQDENLFDSNNFHLVESTVIIDDNINIPFRSLVYDNKIYITDRSNQPSIAIFDITEKDKPVFIKGIGREGRAGGEFLAPDFLVKNPINNYLYIFDAGGRKLVQVNNQDEILTDDLSFRINGMPTDFHIVNENEFITTGIIPNSRFTVVEIDNTNLIPIDAIGEMSTLDVQLSGLHKASAWRSQTVYSKEREQLAMFSSYAKKAELFNKEGDLLQIIQDVEHNKPKVSLVNSEFVFEDDAIVSYVHATSDSKYIYALYSGQPYGDVSASDGNYIHVFDWDLNFIAGFQLDHFSVSITVDNQRGIYSTQHNPEVMIRLVDLSDKI